MGMKFNEDGSKILDGPINKGFDYYFGIPASMNYGYNAWYEMDTAKVPPSLWTRKKDNKIAFNDYRIKPPYEQTKQGAKDIKVAEDFIDIKVLEQFTEKAIAWIDKVQKQDKPFFLYFPMTSPHKPVIPMEKFRGKSQAGAYGDFMIETDFWVGELIKTLEKHGIYKDTMIIFSSDNGPENTWPERVKNYQHYSSGKYKDGKRSIYEGGHRVPFLISWPNGIKAGQRCDITVNQLDVFATIADVVGDKLKPGEAEDSFSFAPAFQGKPFERPPMLHHSISGGFAIREGDWKLILGKGTQAKPGGMELYNLKDDSVESKNVIKAHPEKVKALREKAGLIIHSGKTREAADSQNDTPVKTWWGSK